MGRERGTWNPVVEKLTKLPGEDAFSAVTWTVSHHTGSARCGRDDRGFIGDTLILRGALETPVVIQVWASRRSCKFGSNQHTDGSEAMAWVSTTNPQD